MKALDSSAAAAQAAALSPSSYHDFAGLQGLKGRAREDGQSETALRAAAQQFESMFLQEMMRTMRQATIKGDLLESHALETFEGMFDKEVAMQMAKRGGMGMADMLVQQMKKHLPAEAATGGGAASTSEEPDAIDASDGKGPHPGDGGSPVMEPARAPSTQSVLQGREAAGLPLVRPAVPHELNTARPQPGLPLAGPKAHPLNAGPQGMRLKARDYAE
ncbi:MAG: Peptidoglycan hydrolase FlgJ [Pseudomonadota bacterium]|jgi:flagellar protein FlgJ